MNALLDGSHSMPLEDLLKKQAREASLGVRLVTWLESKIAKLPRGRPWSALKRNARLTAVLTTAAVPGLIFVMGEIAGIWAPEWRPRGAGIAWTGIYVFLVAWCLLAGLSIAKRLERLVPDLRALIPDDTDGETLRSFLQGELKFRKQLWICIVIAALGAAGTGVAMELVDFNKDGWLHHHPGWTWYVILFAAGLLATDGATWLVRLPCIVGKLSGASRLNVLLHAPAQTPGIRALSDLYSLAGFWAAGGFVLVSLPFVWAMLVVNGKTFLVIDAVLVSLVVVMVLWVALGAQFWLSRLVARERDRVADQIALSLPTTDPLELLDPKKVPLRQLFDSVVGASPTTVQGRDALREASKVVVAVLPIGLALLRKTLGLG